MMRLAVFDLDGTLVDSRRDLATAANALVVELGGAPLTEEAVGDMVGEGAGMLVKRALSAAGLPPDTPGALTRFLALYDDHLLDCTRPYAGTTAMLQTVGARMPLAVLTNKPQLATERLLEGLDLRGPFAAVVGGDTEHGRKPDPGGLRYLVSRFGVRPEETLMVGDSPIDLETARGAGTRVCLVEYGFGYRQVELRSGEWRIGSPADLVNVL
jgi:phosphoglycolate phosphatase